METCLRPQVSLRLINDTQYVMKAVVADKFPCY